MTNVAEELVRIEEKMIAKDNLNHTLLTANTAYQIRMAGMEFEIYDLKKEIADLRIDKEEQEIEIENSKYLVKQQGITIVDLKEQVEEYRGY